MLLNLNENDVLCFSIIVTGECNARCTYCHFYNKQGRQKFGSKIGSGLFELYLAYISYIKRNLNCKIQLRFSGGDPLALGDELFILSKMAYKQTGIKPYVLTNGKALSSDIIKKSLRNNISAFVVSLENPFDIDKGAPNTISIINKILKYNTYSLPVKAGTTIVRNEFFHKLTDICDFFYERLQEIPSITELNFDGFNSPSSDEIIQLSKEIHTVASKYFSLTDLDLFSYITPEISNCYTNKYLMELDLTNRFSIGRTSNNYKQILSDYLNKSYPKLNCKKINCIWRSYCCRVKWVWMDKLGDYCRIKKTISESFHDALVRKYDT